MKKVLKWIAILFGIGMIAGCMNAPSKERMNEELKKPEVVEVIEKTIKNIEKNISGENNKIINYEIDYEKTHHNAGGGIEVEVFINGNRDFRISLLVDKSQNKYSVGTSVVSKELANFLEQ